MKIRIEFTTKEVVELSNAIDSEIKLPEKNTTVKGNFGEINYNKNNIIEFDLKEKFVLSYTKLLGSVYNIIKSISSSFMMFSDMWFEDTQIIEESEDDKENHEE